MKAAICFSGMPRTFKSTRESHQKYIFDVLKNNNIEYDLFLHTWDNKVNYVKYFPDEGPPNEIFDYYEFKSHKIETYTHEKMKILVKEAKIHEYENYFRKNNGHQIESSVQDGVAKQKDNVLSCFYGWNEVNKLRKDYEIKNNIKYDLVIKTRFDNLFFDKLNNETLSAEKNTIFSPLGYEGIDKSLYGGVMNDLFLVGDRDSMNCYMSAFHRISDLLKKRLDSKHRAVWHPCGMTKQNLINNNIELKRFYLNHVPVRRHHTHKNAGGVVTGEGWNILIKPTDEITIENKEWKCKL